MGSIPKNNLRERLLKLGYDPNGIQIQRPVLDNSKVVPNDKKPSTSSHCATTTYNTNTSYRTNTSFEPSTSYSTHSEPAKLKDSIYFKPPVIENIEEWSDFEED